MKTQTRMDLVILRDDLRHLEYVMTVLTKKEKLVLTYRYGLYGEKPHTLIGTARAMGLLCTNERIRQIQKDALKKLKRAFLETEGSKTIEEHKHDLLQEHIDQLCRRRHQPEQKKPVRKKRKRKTYPSVKAKDDMTYEEALELLTEWLNANPSFK